MNNAQKKNDKIPREFLAGAFYKKDLCVTIKIGDYDNNTKTSLYHFRYVIDAILKIESGRIMSNGRELYNGERFIKIMGGYTSTSWGASGTYLIQRDPDGEYIEIPANSRTQPYAIRLYAKDLDDEQNDRHGVIL